MDRFPFLIEVHSFVVVLKEKGDDDSIILDLGEFAQQLHWKRFDWSEAGIEFAISTREPIPAQLGGQTFLFLLCGDTSEWHETRGHLPMGHALSMKLDRKSRRVDITNSIIGLPTLFMYQDKNRIIFTSNQYILKCLHGIHLEFNPASVFDLCRVGHTTNYSTLYREVTIIPGGYSLEWCHGKPLRKEQSWPVSSKGYFDHGPGDSPERIMDALAEAFMDVIGNMKTEDAFLSLTAGLDTRTILAALISQKKEVHSACTITGSPPTLDARAASDLCRHYGIRHRTIILDHRFTDELDRHVTTASRLSGGIQGLEQAHEVFFNEQAMNGSGCEARLSGNMGNQVGRGGTGGVSMRNADMGIMNRDYILSHSGCFVSDHWFHDMNQYFGTIDKIALLQYEIANSRVSNFGIGNYYYVQKCPYASRKLIELLQYIPSDDKLKLSSLRMRMRTLRHFFLGQPKQRSFQRDLIVKAGGMVACYPINWGWRASGGVSLRGTFRGMMTLLDMLANRGHVDRPALSLLLSAIGANGMSGYVRTDYWLRSHLKAFAMDTIKSDAPREIINRKKMCNVLHEYFDHNVKTHYRTVCFLLDLSLANRLYKKS